MKGGFREGSEGYKIRVAQIVKKEAQPFAIAGFFGGLLGAVLGSFFAFGALIFFGTM